MKCTFLDHSVNLMDTEKIKLSISVRMNFMIFENPHYYRKNVQLRNNLIIYKFVI